MNRIVITGSLVLLAASVTATTASALHEQESKADTVRTTIESKLNETKAKVDDTATSTVEKVTALKLSQSERVEQRKAELKQKLEEKAAARKERLEGERLARCQNRQTNINALIDRSVENGKTHLANIQRVETRVLEFAEKKSVDPASFQVAKDTADEKEADAIAALDTMNGQNFTCEQVDGADPSNSIRSSNVDKRTALLAYRDSVIELIQTVKAAFAASQSGTAEQTEGAQ